MKKTKALALFLTAAMILPQLAATVSAASEAEKQNIIKIEQEAYVGNGDFDGEPNFRADHLNYTFTNQNKGEWAYNIANPDVNYAHLTTQTESNGNKYMHVETSTTACISYATPKTVPAGEYTLSLYVYPEAGVTALTFRFHGIKGNTVTTAAPQFDANNLVSGQWNNITIPLTITEDTDLVFRFWSNAAGSYRIDDVSLGSPSDVLVESADLGTVTAVPSASALSSNLAYSTWTTTKTGFVRFDTAGEELAVNRDPWDKTIPGSPTIAYCFDKPVNAGTYRVSLELSSAVAQNYYIEIYDATSGKGTRFVEEYISSVFTKATCSYEINVTNDNTLIAFRMYPRPTPGVSYVQPFYIDNVKLEKKDVNKKVYFAEENFETASSVKIHNTTPSNGYTGVTWDNMFPIADKSWFCMDGAVSGTMTAFGVTSATLGGQTVNALKYDKASGTPSFGYVMGALPKGKYKITFDTFGVADQSLISDNSNSANVRVHNCRTTSTLTINASVDFKNNAWCTTSYIEFEVTDNSMDRYLFRFWGCDDFYLDNFKIEVVDAKSQMLVQRDDFEFAPTVTLENGVPRNLSYSWWKLTENQWAYSAGSAVEKMENKVLENRNTIYVKGSGTAIGFDPVGSLGAGNYILNLDLYKVSGGNISMDIRYRKTSSSDDRLTLSEGNTADVNKWTTVSVPFTLTSTTDMIFRFWGMNEGYIGGWSIVKVEDDVWNTVELADYSTEPVLKNDESVGLENVRNYRKTWVSRDLPAMKFVYDSTGKRVSVVPSEKYIYGLSGILYAFDTVFPKGEYSIELKMKPTESGVYKISAIDRSNGTVLSSVSTPTLSKSVYNTVTVPFRIPSDTRVVLQIEASTLTCYSPFSLSDVSVYKLANPNTGLYSNAAVAYFEPSSDEPFYMAATVSGNSGYVNYSNGETLKPGTYKLSGWFRTSESNGADLTAAVAHVSCGEPKVVGGDWTYVEYTVTLSRKMTLSRSTGVRFDLDSNADFCFKGLSLVYLEPLPEPAMNSGIAMVLLKKLQGKMKPQIQKPLYNFVENGELEDKPVINGENLKYAWNKAVAGEWGYSAGDGVEVKLEYAEFRKSMALKVITNGTPAIYHALNSKLDAGEYTFAIDLFVDGNGTKTFSFDVYDITGGKVVRTTKDGVSATQTVKAGEWVTVKVPFVLSEKSDVVFRFWSGSQCNFYVDNASITREGYYADGTVE